MIFIGDLHSNIKHIMYTLNREVLNGRSLIQVGDWGIGFLSTEKELHNLRLLDEALGLHECKLWIMRGNHDDPAYFKGTLKEDLNKELENIVFVEDYEVHEIDGVNVLFIGGGISIDRKARVVNQSYWPDEVVRFDEKKIKEIKDNYKQIEVLVTHSAPMWCYPTGINAPIVRDYCASDKDLKLDLTTERENLSTIFDELNETFKFKYHFYGHFHQSYGEKIVDCEHVLLGIGVFFDLNKFKEDAARKLADEKIIKQKIQNG